MSTDDDKIKHSKRLHDEETAIARQVRIAKEFGVPVTEPHKFAKHHAMNCGNPKCFMCANPRKIWKEKTIQEQRFEQDKVNYEPDDGPLTEEQINEILKEVKEIKRCNTNLKSSIFGHLPNKSD
jgi:hypothetical protein